MYLEQSLFGMLQALLDFVGSDKSASEPTGSLVLSKLRPSTYWLVHELFWNITSCLGVLTICLGCACWVTFQRLSIRCLILVETVWLVPTQALYHCCLLFLQEIKLDEFVGCLQCTGEHRILTFTLFVFTFFQILCEGGWVNLTCYATTLWGFTNAKS